MYEGEGEADSVYNPLSAQGFGGLCFLEPMAGLSSFCPHREEVPTQEGPGAMLSVMERASVTHSKV